MVLGGELIVNKLSILLFSLIFVLNGCAHASQQKEIEVSGIKITLNSENCLLNINGKTLKIEMKPRCYFAIGDSGKDVGVKYYDDIGAHVLLIIGTSAPKDPDYPLTLKRNDCGEQLQALIIKKTTPLLSKVSSNTLVCAGVGADEKVYYILSHP
jgi:hypothetical protein